MSTPRSPVTNPATTEPPVDAARAATEGTAPSTRPGWLIPTHIAAVSLVQSTWMAVAFITPVLDS